MTTIPAIWVEQETKESFTQNRRSKHRQARRWPADAEPWSDCRWAGTVRTRVEGLCLAFDFPSGPFSVFEEILADAPLLTGDPRPPANTDSLGSSSFGPSVDWPTRLDDSRYEVVNIRVPLCQLMFSLCSLNWSDDLLASTKQTYQSPSTNHWQVSKEQSVSGGADERGTNRHDDVARSLMEHAWRKHDEVVRCFDGFRMSPKLVCSHPVYYPASFSTLREDDWAVSLQLGGRWLRTWCGSWSSVRIIVDAPVWDVRRSWLRAAFKWHLGASKGWNNVMRHQVTYMDNTTGERCNPKFWSHMSLSPCHDGHCRCSCLTSDTSSLRRCWQTSCIFNIGLGPRCLTSTRVGTGIRTFLMISCRQSRVAAITNGQNFRKKRKLDDTLLSHPINCPSATWMESTCCQGLREESSHRWILRSQRVCQSSQTLAHIAPCRHTSYTRRGSSNWKSHGWRVRWQITPIASKVRSNDRTNSGPMILTMTGGDPRPFRLPFFLSVHKVVRDSALFVYCVFPSPDSYSEHLLECVRKRRRSPWGHGIISSRLRGRSRRTHRRLQRQGRERFL